MEDAGDSAGQGASGRRQRLSARPDWEREVMALVGAAIRGARKRTGRSIAAVASQVGLDAAYLGELERGRANVSATTLVALASVLGVAASDLLAGVPVSAFPRRAPTDAVDAAADPSS